MSKLTDGFEDHANLAWNYKDDAIVYSMVDVDRLLAHTRKLEAMLKKHEFSDNDYVDNFCPSCYNYEIEGHSPDCELARFIE